MPNVYPPFITPPIITGSIGQAVTADNIITRVMTALSQDTDLTNLFPVGTTLEYIIEEGAGANGPTFGCEIIRQTTVPRALGGPGVGSYSLDISAGIVIQTRQSDKAGTPYLTKQQTENIADQARVSLQKICVDTGTPHLWTYLTPGITQYSNQAGVQRGTALFTVKSTHIRK